MSENLKDSIVQDLIGSMPPPTPTPPPIPAVDRGPDGKPALNSKGKVRGKPGRPSKNRTAPPPRPASVQGEIFDPPADDAAAAANAGNLDASAVTCAIAWESVGMMVMGDEGKFATDQERDAITEAIKNYLAAKGISDVPPGVALTIAAVGYVGARMHRPTVMQRVMAIVGYVRSKIGV